MSQGVKLDEVEAYESELRRAHAENRAPNLKDPYDVHSETLGNTDSHVVELNDFEQRRANAELKKQRKHEAEENDAAQKAMRDHMNRGAVSAILPYTPPDPSRFDPPKTKAEKEAADKQHEILVAQSRDFHDAFNTAPPNTDDDGLVLGDSVNPTFRRKDSTAQGAGHHGDSAPEQDSEEPKKATAKKTVPAKKTAAKKSAVKKAVPARTRK